MKRHQEFLCPQPELLIPHAVNNDVPAAVGGQYPEGQKGKVAPFITQNVPNHKDGYRSERYSESHSESPDGFGCFNV